MNRRRFLATTGVGLLGGCTFRQTDEAPTEYPSRSWFSVGTIVALPSKPGTRSGRKVCSYARAFSIAAHTTAGESGVSGSTSE